MEYNSETFASYLHGDIEVTTKYVCTLCGGERQPTVNIPVENCGVALCLTCLQWFVAKLQTFSRDLFLLSMNQKARREPGEADQFPGS